MTKTTATKTMGKSKRKTMPRDDWHLSRDAGEAGLTGIEFALERVMHAFYRWKAACFAAVADAELTDAGLTGNDVAVLNVVRMKERPKSRTDIASLLNRDDTSNIQYALRKLLRSGLIEKVDAASRKTAAYRITESGVRVTDAYADLRRDLLIAMADGPWGGDADLEAAGEVLENLAGLYDRAARLAATRRY